MWSGNACTTGVQCADLALKVIIGLVLLTGQLEALVDEHLVQLAVSEQSEEVLCLLVPRLTCHKCQLVELEPIAPEPTSRARQGS